MTPANWPETPAAGGEDRVGGARVVGARGGQHLDGAPRQRGRAPGRDPVGLAGGVGLDPIGRGGGEADIAGDGQRADRVARRHRAAPERADPAQRARATEQAAGSDEGRAGDRAVGVERAAVADGDIDAEAVGGVHPQGAGHVSEVAGGGIEVDAAPVAERAAVEGGERVGLGVDHDLVDRAGGELAVEAAVGRQGAGGGGGAAVEGRQQDRGVGPVGGGLLAGGLGEAQGGQAVGESALVGGLVGGRREVGIAGRVGGAAGAGRDGVAALGGEVGLDLALGRHELVGQVDRRAGHRGVVDVGRVGEGLGEVIGCEGPRRDDVERVMDP